MTIGLVSYGISVYIGKSAQQTPPTQSVGFSTVVQFASLRSRLASWIHGSDFLPKDEYSMPIAK